MASTIGNCQSQFAIHIKACVLQWIYQRLSSKVRKIKPHCLRLCIIISATYVGIPLLTYNVFQSLKRAEVPGVPMQA